MSTRWHLRSSRPNSNTANRPIGPAPIMATSVSIGALKATHTKCMEWLEKARLLYERENGFSSSQICFNKATHRLGLALQFGDHVFCGWRICGTDGFGRRRQIAHGKSAHATRRALDRMRHFAPTLGVAAGQEGMEFGHQSAELAVEQPQHFFVQCTLAAGVAGKMLKIDRGLAHRTL